MALRSIHVTKGIIEDMEQVCPRARLFNYTNPVNLVAQAVTTHSDVPFVALCEGPLYSPAELVSAIGLCVLTWARRPASGSVRRGPCGSRERST